MRELDVIDRLRRAFPGCGIGDDAAVLPPTEGELLFAADAAVEGVHFDRRFCTLSQAVQKLVTSNVSDIFAMGGAPGSIVFTAGLPAGCTAANVDGIIDGLKRSCTQYGVKLVGGDTVLLPGAFVFNIAIVGEVERGRSVLRSGARAGDDIVLFGEIGRSLAGLRLLSVLYGEECGETVPAAEAARLLESAQTMKKLLPTLSLSTSGGELGRIANAFGPLPHAAEILRCVQHHLTPLTIPLDASLLGAAPPCVTAMIDVSDGLAKDLRTLCAESGVGAVIHGEALPVPAAIREMFEFGAASLIDFALSSGEEYALLASVAREAAGHLPPGASVIGSFVPAADGLTLVDGTGGARPLPNLGYEHTF
jgi:thiamine-monophosphate kinase